MLIAGTKPGDRWYRERLLLKKALLRTQRPSYKTIKGVIAALAREVGRTDEAAGAYLRGQDYYRKIESAGADNGEKGGR